MFTDINLLQATSYQLPAKRGFTLIEILLVIAMISILASAILVAVSGQRDKARKSKVLVELSGTIQPMVMCWADGGSVNDPTGNICDISAEYGIWPDITESEWDYTTQTLNNSGDWYMQADNGSEYICCNSTYDRCADIGSSSACAVDTNLD